LTRDDVLRGLSQLGGGALVERAMTTGVVPLPPTMAFEHAIESLGQSGLPSLPVVDHGGALIGLLTRNNVTDALLLRKAGVPFPPAEA
jgi:CBS domain-containing protein